MYRRRPSGDYQVGVCTNTLCAVMGGDAIFDGLQEHLGVGNGETTDDGKVTLEHIECNAACDFAPVVMVNWEFFDNQTAGRARSASSTTCAPGSTVAPTRGAPLCTFKETARILAGFPDERRGRRRGERRSGTGLAGGSSPGKGRDRTRARGPSARRRAARPAAGQGPERRDTARPVAGEHLSSHDAPQDTSASDPAHPAGPTAEEGE